MAEKVEVVITGRDEISGVLGGIKGALGGLGTAALGLAAGGLAVLSAGAVGLGMVLKDAVGEAMEAQNVLAQLDAVIMSTGGVAGVTADQVTNLADELQKVTRFSDEAIIGGSNLLLTFKSIGSDIFPDATKAMLDLSTALGQDLKSSAMQLGKALEDPIRGVSALRRVGVSFTEDQENLIKSLVEEGKLMEAQKIILAELNSQVEGSAEAAGKTFAGQLDILKNRFSEIKEELGLKVIPILQKLMDKVVIPLIPFIEKAADAFGNLLTKLTESKDFQVFIGNVADGLQNIIGLMADLADGKFEIPKMSFEVLGDMIPPEITQAVEKSPIMGFLDKMAAWWQEHGPAIKQAAGTLWDGLKQGIDTLMEKIQPFIEKVLDKFSLWMKENGPLIEEFVSTVSKWFKDEFVPALVGAWDIIEPILLGLMDLILNLVTFVMQVITGDWAGAWETAQQIVYDVILAIMESILELGEWILVNLFDQKQLEGAVDRFMSVYPEKFETVKDDILRILDEMGLGYGFAGDALDRFAIRLGERFSFVKDIMLANLSEITNAVLLMVQTLSSIVLPGWMSAILGQGLNIAGAAATTTTFGNTAAVGGGFAGAAGGGGAPVNVQINWQPTLGTASQSEVEQLAPIIERVVQRYNRNNNREGRR